MRSRPSAWAPARTGLAAHGHPGPRAARGHPARRAARGALLLEALIAIVICAFALLGLAGMQARAAGTGFEALQRGQALALVEDMSRRLDANRANAGDYVTAGLIGEGAIADCGATTGAARDLCEWGNLLRGAAETRAGAGVGAMLAARGCVTLAPGTSDRYVIAVAWQGVVATGAPASACGRGDAAFPDEALRRVVTATVCIGRLRDPAAPPAVARC